MKILFADDEKNLREVLTDELTHLGHRVTPCADGNEALAALQQDSFDLLLVDLDMPGASGLAVIEQAKKLDGDVDAVILTGKGTLETAMEAIHHNVSEYLTKPYKISDLEMLLQRIAKRRTLLRKNNAMPFLSADRHLEHMEGFRTLVGSSAAMAQVHRLVDRIAPTDSTVVILGETGTGKELVARAVHEKSHRHKKPFVAVNCGALPEALIESELFGHRKGSFTGADANRTGLLEVADGGTLFLDEIGELPKAVQAKLLRFLESGEVRKIGENNSTVCNVRVVCATLRNLEIMVKANEFREDLWFRINTFEIHLPPLRERCDDIAELIPHLVARFRPETTNLPLDRLLTSDALKKLLQYEWPGNVRQLANTIEHALILADGFPIDVDALPQILNRTSASAPIETLPVRVSAARAKEGKSTRPVISKPADSSIHLPALTGPMADLMSFNPTFEGDQIEPTTLRDLEMKAIESAMRRHDGNKSKAAEELGISLKTLYNKLSQTEKKTA